MMKITKTPLSKFCLTLYLVLGCAWSMYAGKIHDAVKRYNKTKVEALLDQHPECIHEEDSSGRTPLECLVDKRFPNRYGRAKPGISKIQSQQNKKDLVLLLMQKGACVTSPFVCDYVLATNDENLLTLLLSRLSDDFESSSHYNTFKEKQKNILCSQEENPIVFSFSHALNHLAEQEKSLNYAICKPERMQQFLADPWTSNELDLADFIKFFAKLDNDVKKSALFQAFLTPFLSQNFIVSDYCKEILESEYLLFSNNVVQKKQEREQLLHNTCLQDFKCEVLGDSKAIKRLVLDYQSYRLVPFLYQENLLEDGDVTKIIQHFCSHNKVDDIAFLEEHGFDQHAEIRQWYKRKFLQAADRGDLGLLQQCVAKGISVAVTDSFGNTALHKAMMNEDKACIDWLFQQKAPLECVNGMRETPYRSVANAKKLDSLLHLHEWGCGNEELSKLMLEKLGTSIVTATSTFPYTTDPARSVNMIKKIHNAGISLDQLCYLNMTPLQCALFACNTDAVKELLSANVDLFMKSGTDKNIGYYLQHYTTLCADRGLYPSCIMEMIDRCEKDGRSNELQGIIPALTKVRAHDENGNTILHHAVLARKKEFITALLDVENHQATVKNTAGKTPLCMAYETKDSEILKLFTAKKICVADGINLYKKLLQAATRGDETDATFLLDGGVTHACLYDDTKETPLHLAVKNNHERFTQLLLNRGANAFAKDKNNRLPIDIVCETENETLLAAFHGQDKCKDYICRFYEPGMFSADIQKMKHALQRGVSLASQNESGQTPLHVALAQGNKDAIAFLLEKSDELKQAIVSGDIITYAVECIRQHNKSDVLLPLLWWAVDHEALAMVQECMACKMGHRIAYETDDNGNTILHRAVLRKNGKLCSIIFQQVPALCHVANREGKRPHDIAKKLGEERISDDLKHTYVITEDRHGMPAIFYAIEKDDTQALKALLDAKATITNERCSGNNKTSLEHAVCCGSKKAIAYLLDDRKKRCDPGVALDFLLAKNNPLNITPLHIAAQNNDIEMVRSLIGLIQEKEKVSDELCLQTLVNACDATSKTPLHYAAQIGNAELVELITSHGADKTLRDSEGRQPAAFALLDNHIALAELLFTGDVADKPKVMLSDIIGLDEIKLDLYFMIDRLSHAAKEYAKKTSKEREEGAQIPRYPSCNNDPPIKALLLYGPPGTGKTLLARAVANEVESRSGEKCCFISVKMTEMRSKWVNQSVEQIEALFEKARKNRPTVLFFDEIDAIGNEESNAHNEDNKATLEFIQKMQGFDNMDYIFIIATTNNPDKLVGKLQDRFDEMREVLPLAGEAQKKLLKTYFDQIPVLQLNHEQETVLCQSLQGFSTRDIKAVVHGAHRRAGHEARKQEKEGKTVSAKCCLPTTLTHFKESFISRMGKMHKFTSDEDGQEYREKIPLLQYQEKKEKELKDAQGKQCEKNGPEKITFDNIIGLDNQMLKLKGIVHLICNPDICIQRGVEIPKAILLDGPPGTGKTTIAKALANEAHCDFFSCTATSFQRDVREIRRAFKKARQAKTDYCILFIDELDIIGSARGFPPRHSDLAGQLLTEMEGFTTHENCAQVIVLAATNHKDSLDLALKDRFQTVLNIPLPNEKARKAILQYYLSKQPFIDEVVLSDGGLYFLAEHTDGFSGRKLEALVKKAARLACERDDEVVNIDHFAEELGLYS